jgi:hypothetical protein
MTKRGSQDNVVTYEHYCDTKADLANIPQSQISLGSVAIVLQDDNGGMGIYLANSNKEWISFSSGEGGNGGESSMSDISLANLLDISLTEPVDGQTLVYNGETEKWENKESSSGDGGTTLQIHQTIDGFYSIPTYEELKNIDVRTITKVIVNGTVIPLFFIDHPAAIAPFFVDTGEFLIDYDGGNKASIRTFMYTIDSGSVTKTNGPVFEATKS